MLSFSYYYTSFLLYYSHIKSYFNIKYPHFCVPMLGSCLIVDPRNRPSVDSIIAQLYSIADKLGENFDKPPVSHVTVT